ncbi:hypothetical protein [Thermostaphylospora chromogena]|uniref:Molybdopterin oxidoreductase n=1 Tax=Thermostaphylospora chromogena TaxID=35622 RepID=A0A1H1BJB5_9ACTN|nr:hypothetical protein [Thermostaphylospora chromogena]SDQ52074.1 hypothetical protein SAMN04489764_0996 [Thermostaphylospora chromogena]
MYLAHYLGLLRRSEEELARAFRDVGRDHAAEPDVFHVSERLAGQCEEHARRLEPFVGRYAEEGPKEPERLAATLFQGSRTGGLGLLRDLHDLYLMASGCDIAWTVVAQAARGLRDTELLSVVRSCERETRAQLLWLTTRMKQAAPQALIVAA